MALRCFGRSTTLRYTARFTSSPASQFAKPLSKNYSARECARNYGEFLGGLRVTVLEEEVVLEPTSGDAP